MGLLNKKKKKTKRSFRSGSGGGSSVETSPLRPQFVEKRPPCSDNCPNHNRIREMLMIIQKAEDYEKSYDQAFEEAWHVFSDTTPFPAVCGRVCPHPCESECNRKEREGAVGINSMERYIGDFGLTKKLKPKLLTEDKKSQKVAVVGAGPGGLSAAYHLARQGYPVTVFEAFPKAGGMLRYGIPDYRLPQDVLDGEINRIAEMGVEIKLNTSVGNDIPYDNLKKDYDAIFVALGAHKGYQLRVAGEDAPNVFTGTAFLNRVNSGEKVEVGDHVVVIGGGDTAIDAARIARRLGAKATILYRRTKTEMPAIDEEIDGAVEEDIAIEFLAAPIEIYKDDSGKATGMKCQRMELGEPDDSGRRRPVPIDGDTFDLQFSTLIAAISQQPNFDGFDEFIEGRDWIKVDEKHKTKIDKSWAGGDNTNLGLVIDAIAHGRLAALAIHENLSGETQDFGPDQRGLIKFDKMMLAYYEEKLRNNPETIEPAERLKEIDLEVTRTFSEETAIAEAKRCMSCGKCFDCGSCWSYCQDNAVVKPLIKGEPYKFKLDFCNGCKKCAENCPCGYIEMH